MDATDILGGLLQGALGGTSRGRLGHAMGERGLGGRGGPLGQILGQLAGGAGAGTRSGGGRDVLGDLSSLSRQLGRGSSATRGHRAGSAGGLAEAAGRSGFGSERSPPAAASAPAADGGGVLGGNMRGAVGAGGLAVLAWLAMNALRGSGARTAPAPAEAPEAATGLPDEALSEEAAMLALRAMIDAAKVDGQIDGNEMGKILGKLDDAGAGAEEKNLVLDELRKPSDIDGLAAAATTPALAAQTYAAALLAIEVDTDAERQYLRRLSSALRLQPDTLARLHEALGAPALRT